MSAQTLQLFRDMLDANELAQTRVSYRVVGGLRDEPGLPLLPSSEEVLIVDGAGAARLLSGATVVNEAPLEAANASRLFEQVRASLPALVTRSEAAFIPDSVVGEITVEIAGEQEQLYFLIDDDRPADRATREGIDGMIASLHEIGDLVRPHEG